ncbi:MAG: site-2 protease family protein [Saprospiraceae bacterium]|nr:site-2 protease family protein [Saprospiraceae bacterium]
MLSNAFRLFSVAGIPLKVHWTFGFFFLWIAYAGYRAGMDQTGIVHLCLFAVVLFCCVVLHEFGHALTARRYGVSTKDIIISPIGGVARLISMPEKPVHELIIAIAGPMVNLVIATILGTFLVLVTDQGVGLIGNQVTLFNHLSNFLPALFWLNLFLIGFNLLPAFPMDGGRIFRSILSMRIGKEKATRIAAMMGQSIAIGFLVYGIYRADFILGFIGLFVFFSAAFEYRSVRADTVLNSSTVEHVFRRTYTPIFIDDPMQKAISLTQKGKEKDFIVLDQKGQMHGVLHEEFVKEALKKNAAQEPVGSFTSPNYEKIGPHINLKHIFQLFQRNGYSIVPVFSQGVMIGVIDRRILNQFVRSKASLWSTWKKH